MTVTPTVVISLRGEVDRGRCGLPAGRPDSHYNHGVDNTPDPAAETLPADTDAVAAARDRSAAAEKV